MHSDSSSSRFVFERACFLAAPPEIVFETITRHEGLPRWAPGVARVEVDDSKSDTPGGVGAVRTLYPRFGPPGQEVIWLMQAPTRFGYSATDASLRGLCTQHATDITIEPQGSGSMVRWKVSTRPGPGLWRRWVTAWLFRFAVTRSLANLRALLSP